ncbi:unnamed protein product [Eruca vesicaria subsp. sativa]|uniref:Uncharacterized protein n=1 Tax=Eruca vesicaria subsp. sativa TaxID=29727 RepID=A0ABC8KKV3_ERUVS|nr:unnamed protein product [Eruca vesicaria subsp. sativa]
MNPMFYSLLALTAVLAATANAGGPPVLDIYGKPIFGGSYYVLPAISGPAGGGLTLVRPPSDKQCPLYVGQESSEVEKGTPVKFSNWRSRVGFVPESADLNIEMDGAATICVQSTYWSLVPSNLSIMNFYVEAGPKPKPGEDLWGSFFQIKRSGEFHNGYHIASCSNDGDCMNLGISTDESGVRRLTLLGVTSPFPVVFMKASDIETSPKTMSII